MSIYLYHYTDCKGWNGIQSLQTIKRKTTADQNHARYGHGVYFSSLKPHTEKSEIARYNYQGGGDAMMSKGRVDYYVEVKFSRNDPNLKFVDFWRHIYVCKDKDVCLKDFTSVKFGRTGDTNYTEDESSSSNDDDLNLTILGLTFLGLGGGQKVPRL